MLSPDKTGLLKSFLGGLPGPIAARLATAVEVDRMMDGHALPHEDILSGLRPILQRDHFDRTPTPLRLFCRPFQDLLTSAPRRGKQKGCIARGSLLPVWNWVAQVLLPRETTAYIEEAKTLILARKYSDANARAAQFWPLAGQAMAQLLAKETGRAAAQKILGNAMVVEDAIDMAQMLSVGQTMEHLAVLLPSPVPSLNEALLWEVRAIYDQLAASAPDAAPYVAVVTMNRLVRPWEALRLPLLVTRHTDETLISKTDMGLVGEILFDRMENLKTAIKATRHPLFDAEKLMEEVKTFADLSSRIVKEIEIKREGEWGKRLLAERVDIGKVMEGFMERAPREFAAALPMQKATGADFSRPISEEKREMALRYARLVGGCRPFAAAASFAAKHATTCDELCALLKRYNEDVIKELKSAKGERAGIVASQYLLCTELTAILFSEQEAELLRRRGRAAQAAA